ncbi:MAG: TraR/DksA family transcriptional regulator [Casimicrobium sp.]
MQPTSHIMPAHLRALPYMSSPQTNWFRGRISAELARVNASLEEIRNQFDPDTAVAIADDNERASTEEQIATARGNSDRLTLEAHALNAALRRIDNGEYGWCSETGEEIGLDRLVAVPSAVRCIATQEVVERRRSQYARAA